ncbi:50S ribosomal protein L21 [Govanella unica]|uniref:Large ribosomal subunit protein bL21 n=1 Tax=Govanella unica TaxID=2975056 RepID=A0A9X3TW19_9PROT|nr:50S ribosomal protein L21 [Govania unica]MDA5192776.1 50S ribosomal protein L21 [Govania unica]
MFAVVKTGGKQYKVAAGDFLKVEKLAGEAGSTVEFEVLMVGDDKGVQVGAPLITTVPVIGEIVAQIRGEKIIIFKKQRRHHYRRRNGHRQNLTVIRIASIGGVEAAPKAPKAEAAATEAAPKAAKTSTKKAAQATEE